MLIEKISIKHFRCLRGCEITIPNYAALVGPNGVGKSTVLEAIRFVLEPKFRLEQKTLNPDCKESPLEVSVTFRDLTKMESDAFASILAPDGTLSITRRVTISEDGESDSDEFIITRLKHAAFQDIRELLKAGQNVPAKDSYNSFAKGSPAYSLPQGVTRYGDVEGHLAEWERKNPKDCIPADDPINARALAALGWPPITPIFIPAVRDAAQDIEGSSPLQRLLNLMVVQPASVKPEMLEIQEKILEQFHKVFPEGSKDLDDVAEIVNSDLSAFAPGSSVQLTWDQDFIPEIRPPQVLVEVTEDDFSSSISDKGHGVQRAVILAMVSVADRVRKLQMRGADDEGGADNAPASIEKDVLLMIEEPELYQHPIRARHFADALRRRTEGTAGMRTQVVFTTHSPDFISLSDFEGIRLLRRRKAKGMKVPLREIGSTTLDEVADELQKAQGAPTLLHSGDRLRARLHGVLDTSLREGFFADSVVLVEGDVDQGAIVGAFKSRSFDYEAYGVAVLPVNGKTNLDKALVIFRQLGIPTYVIFDGDKKPEEASSKSKKLAQKQAEEANNIKHNRALLALLKQPAVDHPQTQVHDTFAVFHNDFDTTLAEEFGPALADELRKGADLFGYDHIKQAQKVPHVNEYALRELSKKGLKSKTLDDIMTRIESTSRRARQAVQDSG